MVSTCQFTPARNTSAGMPTCLIGLITCTESAHAHAPPGPTWRVTASVDDCFLALRGLRTLALRLGGTRRARSIAQVARSRSRGSHLSGAAGSRVALWERDFSGACGLFAVVLKPVSKQRIDAMLDGMRYSRWASAGVASRA
jgi:cystathionine beta-lyase